MFDCLNKRYYPVYIKQLLFCSWNLTFFFTIGLNTTCIYMNMKLGKYIVYAAFIKKKGFLGWDNESIEKIKVR